MKTAEDYFEKKFGNKITASESWVIRFAEEYAEQFKGGYSKEDMRKAFDAGTRTTGNTDAFLEQWLSSYPAPKQEEGWISVKDRLPLQEQGFYKCLSYSTDGNTRMTMFNCLIKQFQSMNFDVITNIVTHWMPLPSPPQSNDVKP